MHFVIYIKCTLCAGFQSAHPRATGADSALQISCLGRGWDRPAGITVLSSPTAFSQQDQFNGYSSLAPCCSAMGQTAQELKALPTPISVWTAIVNILRGADAMLLSLTQWLSFGVWRQERLTWAFPCFFLCIWHGHLIRQSLMGGMSVFFLWLNLKIAFFCW